MFAKLLKHEFRAQKKTFFILSIAALGVGILGSLLLWMIVSSSVSTMSDASSVIIAAFGTLGLLGIILALLAYVLAIQIILWVRFYRHHFTGEGYLTFTLPVTTTQILWASIVNIVIWIFISTLVFALSIGIILIPALVEVMKEMDWKTFFDSFREAFLSMQEVYEEVGLNVFTYIFSGIASFISRITLPLLCITIGSIIAKKHKLLASFGIYYGINMAISIISGILSAVATLADTVSDFSRVFSFSIVMPGVIQLCVGIGSYCLMHYLISKKLNLQ